MRVGCKNRKTKNDIIFIIKNRSRVKYGKHASTIFLLPSKKVTGKRHNSAVKDAFKTITRVFHEGTILSFNFLTTRNGMDLNLINYKLMHHNLTIWIHQSYFIYFTFSLYKMSIINNFILGIIINYPPVV